MYLVRHFFSSLFSSFGRCFFCAFVMSLVIVRWYLFMSSFVFVSSVGISSCGSFVISLFRSFAKYVLGSSAIYCLVISFFLSFSISLVRVCFITVYLYSFLHAARYLSLSWLLLLLLLLWLLLYIVNSLFVVSVSIWFVISSVR